MESMGEWKTGCTIPNHKKKKMMIVSTARIIITISKIEPLIYHSSMSQKLGFCNFMILKSFQQILSYNSTPTGWHAQSEFRAEKLPQSSISLCN